MTWTIFRNELRMVLRDTRTVLIAVVAPLVLFPLVIFVTNYVEDRETERLETTTYELAVTGEREAWARGVVEAALAVGEGGGSDGPDGGLQPVHFEMSDTDDPDSLLQAGDLHLVLEGRDAIPEGFRVETASSPDAVLAAASQVPPVAARSGSTPTSRAPPGRTTTPASWP